MITIAEALRIAAAELSPSSGSARLDAEVLLARVLGASRAALIARDDQALDGARHASFTALVGRRAAGAPVAYLTGAREFWSLDLAVSPAVLVPRPETELLVELALQRLAPDCAAAVLDLGTGSGAIALAVASERPAARVTGVDVSAAALEVAAANGRRLGLSGIDWRLGSWFDATPRMRFHLILSNPPYVAAGDPALAHLRAEPDVALTPGPTGLEAFAAIAAGAAAHLHAGGWLLLEHGAGQAAPVAELLRRRGFLQISTHPDHSGRDRVTLATTPPSSEERS